MGELTFSTERLVRASPDAVFARVAADPAPGWLFGFTCDRLAAGRAVSFNIPGRDGDPVRGTGRLLQVDPGRRLVIRQESPWEGRITLALDEHADGTRARLIVALADDCVPWFLPPAQAPAFDGGLGGPRLGVMVSLSGSAGLLGRAAVNAAQLAVEVVNSDGGVRGRPLQLAVGDDRTHPGRAVAEFLRLTEDLRCEAVIAMVPSASFQALLPAARARQTLLIHSPLTEAGPSQGTVFRLGERPADQLSHSIPALMKETGARGWYIVGNDYCWPRAVGKVARRVIAESHGTLLGERYVPLGQRSSEQVIGQIEDSGADLVLSSLVGHDAVTFERSFYQMGLRARARTIAVLMDDTVREHIGDDAATGMWAVLDYFQCGDDGGDAVSQAWRARFGQCAPPLSSTAMSVYQAVHLYAQAAHLAGSGDAAVVADVLRSKRLGRSRMLDRAAGLSRPTAIAEAAPGGFRVHAAPR